MSYKVRLDFGGQSLQQDVPQLCRDYYDDTGGAVGPSRYDCSHFKFSFISAAQ